jgi:DNA-3-methyladenine glycosylase II
MGDVHRILLRRAGKVMPSLRSEMIRVGRQALHDRSEMPVSLYLCRSVVSQQLSGKAARTIWGRVESHALVSRSSLASAIRRRGHEWLRDCGVSGSKSRAIAEILRADREGLLDGDLLAELDHAERSARVSQIWGVGQWTCDMLSMFYFADPDVWPRADTSANRELAALMRQDRLDGTTLEMADNFRPYRSYLALYLWRIADKRTT